MNETGRVRATLKLIACLAVYAAVLTGFYVLVDQKIMAVQRAWFLIGTLGFLAFVGALLVLFFFKPSAK